MHPEFLHEFLSEISRCVFRIDSGFPSGTPRGVHFRFILKEIFSCGIPPKVPYGTTLGDLFVISPAVRGFLQEFLPSFL